MKKILIFIGVILIISNSIFSQSEFGFKIGLSSYDLATKNIGSSSDLKLSIDNASYGIHAGLYGRIGIMGLYIQPEILFNSNTINYKIEDLGNIDNLNQIRTTKYQNLDIPVMIMFTPSFFKLYAGPVGHYLVNDITEFKQKDKIKELFNNLTYGYQMGVGVTLNGLTLDVRYEGSFTNRLNTFVIDGKEFNFDHSPSRYIFSLWFKL